MPLDQSQSQLIKRDEIGPPSRIPRYMDPRSACTDAGSVLPSQSHHRPASCRTTHAQHRVSSARHGSAKQYPRTSFIAACHSLPRLRSEPAQTDCARVQACPGSQRAVRGFISIASQDTETVTGYSTRPTVGPPSAVSLPGVRLL